MRKLIFLLALLAGLVCAALAVTTAASADPVNPCAGISVSGPCPPTTVPGPVLQLFPVQYKLPTPHVASRCFYWQGKTCDLPVIHVPSAPILHRRG